RMAAVVVLAAALSTVAHGRRADAVCVGDCNNTGTVTVAKLITMVNISLEALPITACEAGDINQNHKIEINEIVMAVNNPLGGSPPETTAPPTPTASATPSATTSATPTATGTFGVLGTRHYVLSKAKSPWQVVLGPGFKLTLGGFQGQTNGVV